MRRIFALPLSLSLLALGISAANAQQDEIYELVTTAIHNRSSETALPVTVLTNEALHDAVRATLGDTLSSQPGINNASFGPAVGQTVIRGQQGRRVMNLSNGMPNADASGNSADHAQTVEAILADAIEVLRGPSTLLYGGGAIGGVVNVIDKRIASTLPEKPAFAVEARHDTAANLDTAVGSLDFATGNLVWHVDALRREWDDLKIPGLAIAAPYLEADRLEGDHPEANHPDEDSHAHEDAADAEHEDEHPHEGETDNTLGHIPNTGGKTEAITGGLSWIFDTGFLGLAVSQLDNTYGLPSGAHEHAHEEHEETEPGHDDGEHGETDVLIDMARTRYDLSGEWHNLTAGLEKLTYRASYTDYEHAELEGPGVVGTRFSNASWQHRLQLTHAEVAGWHGVMGLQHSDEEFGAVGAESFIPVTDIGASGIFLVEDYHAGPVTVELGARLNRDAYSPQHSSAPARDFSTTSFSASALWDVNAPITLGLSLAHSERAPSIEELYSNHGLASLDTCVIHFATASCELGNIDFAEETSLNTDFTVYLDYGVVDATFTLFYNDFKDYIGQITTGEEIDGFPVRLYQQGDARFSGIEVDVNLPLGDHVGLRVFGDTITGSFDSSFNNAFGNNSDVPRMPPSRVGVELTISGEQWSTFATLLHANEQDKPGAFELPSASWNRLDIGADYTFNTGNEGELLVFIKGRNIGDQEIRLASSYLRGFAPEAGRSVEAGVRYRF